MCQVLHSHSRISVLLFDYSFLTSHIFLSFILFSSCPLTIVCAPHLYSSSGSILISWVLVSLLNSSGHFFIFFLCPQKTFLLLYYVRGIYTLRQSLSLSLSLSLPLPFRSWSPSSPLDDEEERAIIFTLVESRHLSLFSRFSFLPL